MNTDCTIQTPYLVFHITNIGDKSLDSNLFLYSGMAPEGQRPEFDIIIKNGNWNELVINLNGKEVRVSQGYGTLKINNIRAEATWEDGSNAFGLLSGNIDTFLELVPGNNTLVIEGLESGEAIINYTPVWI
jgi:hypothetical protein